MTPKQRDAPTGQGGSGVSVVRLDPFSPEALGLIFRVSPQHPDRLVSRENSWLEFKKSFNKASLGKYSRSCAAFANAKGGYIVFGVDNNPHLMVGLQTNNFDETDPAVISGFFNEHFSPEIRWDMHVHEFMATRFGLFYVHESLEKPIICTRGDPEIKEAEIYYRYRGRTSVIRYAELRAIMDDVRRRERHIWLQHLGRIARIGVRDAGVFDLATGTTVTGSGGAFVIDASLLDRLKFLREGEFHEKKGAPTVRIIGEAQLIGSGMVLPTRTLIKTRTVSIRTPEIINAFLEDVKVPKPEEYIRQACFETHSYLPIYHFMRQAKLTRSVGISLISKVPSTSQGKFGLLGRLRGHDSLGQGLPNEASTEGRRKLQLRQELLEKRIVAEIPVGVLLCVLQVISTLRPSEVDAKYLRPLLKSWFDKYYADENQEYAWQLRQAICFVDRVLNRDAISGS